MLRGLGISSRLLRFIRSFLTSRQLRVRIPGATSPPRPVRQGVPQGSVLSPSLFLIMLDDMFRSCPPEVSYSIYADDCSLWIRGADVAACARSIQLALDAVGRWSRAWGLTFSTSKSKAMLFTRRRSFTPPPLTLYGTPLSYTNTHRFLGITLDRGYTFRPHITALRDRCVRDLRLLRIASAHGWGADFPTLRTLYTHLTLSKLDYASFLFSPAAPSTLLILDRVQYAAARIMLGALRCTPVISLEAEAHLMPLALRRRYLLLQYTSRVLCLPHHPVRRLLLDFYHYQFYRTQPLPLPSLVTAHTKHATLHLPFPVFPTTSIAHGFSLCPLPIRTSLHVHVKSGLSDSSWRSLFHSLLSTYSSYTFAYCDGSKSASHVGSGVWSPHGSVLARLSAHNSALTAELYALYSAVSFLSAFPGPFVVFTDSLSSLSSLLHVSPRSHFLVLRLAALLSSFPLKFVLEWVPSHVGVPGNERADQLAKSASLLPRVTSTHLSSRELQHLLRQHYNSACQSQWSLSPSPLLSYKPLLGLASHLALPRRLQVCISRLRLGTTRLTHAHYFTGSPPSQCPTCRVPWSIQHLLLSCPSSAAARSTLARTCAVLSRPLTLSTVLSDSFPVEVLAGFLAAAGYPDIV